MNEFLTKALSWTGAGGAQVIRAFNVWHFIYLGIIAAVMVVAVLALKGRQATTQKRVLNILAVSVLCWYIANFFLQPFAMGTNQLNVDKLPFHICTLMSIVAVWAQFSQKDWFKEVAVTLAMVGTLMYLIYPSTAFGDDGMAPWCYRVIETMVYHSALFAWGFLSLTTGQVKLQYKHIWMPLVGLICVALWATVGNVCYNTSYLGKDGNPHYDWFFLTGTTFDMTKLAAVMPLLVIGIMYAVIACFYLINFICHVVHQFFTTEVETESEIKTTNGIYRVSYRRLTHTWVIKRDRASRIIGSFFTKAEALERVNELSENQDVGWTVKKKNGRFQKKR